MLLKSLGCQFRIGARVSFIFGVLLEDELCTWPTASLPLLIIDVGDEVEELDSLDHVLVYRFVTV